ncbi:MAG: ATP-binding protein [Fibrobacter sp.]|uniref:AlbA family DNA-binding domain-containing protein n=1 Tax=Fibrobacter sp. TaxID=35828 RepID=UPI0025C58CDE|nr:ATP-binding protein [Fibrobacter sp.]MBQ9226186.1 ATP-binding protein [Fibrobacter sp.]
MLYTPFKTPQDFESLIHLGETPENIYWDYKSVLNSKDPTNIAIDMAAFANTYGGTILIGLSEKGSEELNGLKVAMDFVPKIDAESIKKQICSIASNYIFPPIDVKVDPIKILDNLIVAVNIDPSVNLVGVRTNNERGNFCFPYRTEYGNQFMIFEEVEKRMMDNKTRAMYLKLKKYFPADGKVNVYPAPVANNKVEWRFEWIHNSENEIRLDQNGYRSIDIPISFIEEVWNGRGGICIKLNSRLFCASPNFIDFDDSEDAMIFKQMLKFRAQT